MASVDDEHSVVALQGLASEALRLAAHYASVKQDYTRVRNVFWGGSAVLAGVASCLALAEVPKYATAIAAFLAATLAVANGHVRPDERKAKHKRLAAGYELLAGLASDSAARPDLDLPGRYAELSRLRALKCEYDSG